MESSRVYRRHGRTAAKVTWSYQNLRDGYTAIAQGTTELSIQFLLGWPELGRQCQARLTEHEGAEWASEDHATEVDQAQRAHRLAEGNFQRSNRRGNPRPRIPAQN